MRTLQEDGASEVYEILDQLGWKVEPVQDTFLQARGIQAFISDITHAYSITIKTDMRAMRTGLASLEHTTIKHGVPKPGWLYQTCAQLLLYFVPGEGIYAFDVTRTRKHTSLATIDMAPPIESISFSIGWLYKQAGIWKHEWK